MAPLLEVRNLSMHFGGLTAVDQLSFQISPGEIVSLIGPNGAGKTTVFNLITGVYTPSGGNILFENRSIRGLKPDKIVRRGIARTFQTLRLFTNLSVLDNVMASQHHKLNLWHLPGAILRTPGYRKWERQAQERAIEKMEFFGPRLMGYRFDQPAYALSYANRRRLEIARAMATEPKLLLLDEPAAGMNPKETREISEIIRQIRDQGGYSILLIEHDMKLVAGISERVIALDYGKKIAEGSYSEVATDPNVIEAYLGRHHQEQKEDHADAA